MRIFKNISYSSFDECTLDIYLPEEKEFSLFVYFHGGGLDHGDKSGAEIFAKFLTDRNIAVVSANYRLYPQAQYPDFIKDAAAVVDWASKNISEYGNCEKIYIGGSSAGAYISMLLQFDKKYLDMYNIDAEKIGGFIHDAGQPTTHFNVLKERGIDGRRIIVDDAAPLYYVGLAQDYAPMLIIVSDNDMENRIEQLSLLLSTLKHFRYDENKVELKIMHGKHTAYVKEIDCDGNSVFGKLVAEFINKQA